MWQLYYQQSYAKVNVNLGNIGSIYDIFVTDEKAERGYRSTSGRHQDRRVCVA
jgi:hypothetical protein